ncbi:MAG: VIT domain-containing protein [Burkholderiales bacterium]
MNRRKFLLNMRTMAVAGCAFNLVHGAAAQDVRPVISPPRLTVAQGAETPVVLQAIRIETEISGSRALTTVEMTFFNPNRRILEGELQFPLLDGQQVSGFALDIDGKLREAVPVEKAKGQQVFEDVIRQRIDPALLQVTAGNNYKLRVYPLPAQGTRRVMIRYAESLPVSGALRRYRLPLDYARDLAGFSLRVLVRAPEHAPALAGTLPQGLAFRTRGVDYDAEISRKDFAARGVLEVHVPVSVRPEVHTQSVGDKTYFVAEVPARLSNTVLRNVTPVVGIVWDASGSGATRDHVREFALLDTYFKRMGNGEVRLTRVRDAAEAVERFRISNGEWGALRRALEATAYDGATQLGAFTPETGVGEYLLFSDGLDNFGERPFAKLNVPLHTISAATRADPARLRQLAESSAGSFIDLASLTAVEAARRLLYREARIQSIDGNGVSMLTAVSRVANNGRWLVAGQLLADRGVLSVTVSYPGSRAGSETISVPVRAAQNADNLAAAAWAQMRVTELDGEYRLHRAEIRRLGMEFGLTSRETSLIVLDRIEDYVRNEITPPAELRAEYDRQRQNQHLRAGQERTQQLDRVVRMLKEKATWWEKDFPKNARPQPETKAKIGGGPRLDGAVMQERAENESRRSAPAEAASRDRAPASPPPRPAMRPAPSGQAQSRLADAMVGGLAAGKDDTNTPRGMSIQLKRWTPDAPYFKRFNDASADELYRVYLDERAGYVNSTAFFLDAADVFFDKGLVALGVRVLGNLAEMDLENRHILRILGYRLMQAGQAKLAIPILARVLELAPNEPQSYRDLGLVYAADKQWQKAVENLNEVVIRPWHGRFPEIELTALDELNAIIATADTSIDTSRFDARLLRNLPVDLRVALSWDADNTDIDLWVTDPNGEKAYYGNRISYQGGRMSQDYTGGYGPETFSLKQAKPGKYKVEANFYGHNQQIVAGATTLQLKLTTRFGTREQQEQVVTLRLKGRSEVVQVGEFEVK